jgi:hypothetical protein
MLINLTHSTLTLLALYLFALYLALGTLYNYFVLVLTGTDAVRARGRVVSRAGGVEGPGKLFSLFLFFLFLSLLFLSFGICVGMFPIFLSLIFREELDWAPISQLESAVFDIDSV